VSREAKRRADARTGYGLAAMVLVIAALFGLVVMPLLGKKGDGRVGTPAPEFLLPVMNGKFERPELRLSDLEGKVVIVDFWASWCGPCRVQAPIVERVAKSHRALGVMLVGVATSDQRKSAENYASRHPSEFPALFDEDEAAARAYGVEGLPTLAIIDRKGMLVALRSGLVREAELEELVQSALSGG
jgi:cytochrome c biogenesis protein CcmG/thiol:disulfide interchange protein DsbE